MRLNGFFARSAVLALLLSGCSDESALQSSKVSDVSMPGENGQQVLFWGEGANILRGTCTSTPARRAVCKTDVQTKTREQVTTLSTKQADEELAKLAKERADEIAKIKAQDPTSVSLTGQINSLTAEKTNLGQEVKDTEAEIAADTAEKAKNDELLVWYVAELKVANEQLVQKPGDPDLTRLVGDLSKEKADLDVKIADLVANLAVNNARLVQVKALLASVTERLEVVRATLAKHLEALVLDSALLRANAKGISEAQAGKAAIVPVLDMIAKADLTQRSNLLTVSEARGLLYISQIWANNLLKPGRYKATSGDTGYCLQAVQPSYENGVLKKVKVSFLSPCNSGADMVCTGLVCQASNFKLTVRPASSYEFKEGSYPSGIFTFQSALTDETFADLNQPNATALLKE